MRETLHKLLSNLTKYKYAAEPKQEQIIAHPPAFNIQLTNTDTLFPNSNTIGTSSNTLGTSSNTLGTNTLGTNTVGNKNKDL